MGQKSKSSPLAPSTKEEDVDLNHLFEMWSQDRPLDASRVIFQYLPFKDRVYWASSLLKWAFTNLGIECEYVASVLQAAQDRGRWKLGHDLSSAGSHVLADLAKDDQILHTQQSTLIWLAILTARIMYNASLPQDPYDDDTGWYVGATLRKLADAKMDPTSTKEAWKHLTMLIPR